MRVLADELRSPLYLSSTTQQEQQQQEQLLQQEGRLGGVEPGWHRRLEYLSSQDCAFYPEDFAAVVKSLNRLIGLDLTWTGFDLSSWRALQGIPRHRLESFTELELIGCVLPGSAIQEMLCSMRSLEVFAASNLADKDILDDGYRPWVCRRLRILRLTFVMLLPSESTSPLSSPPSSSPSLLPSSSSPPPLPSYSSSQSMILAMLSKLDQLEEHDLGDGLWTLDTDTPCDTELLHVSLQDGVDQLTTLSRLRSFAGPPRKVEVEWGVAEVHWTQKYWPKLEELYRFNLTADALELLKSDEIDTVDGPSYYSDYHDWFSFREAESCWGLGSLAQLEEAQAQGCLDAATKDP